MADKGEEEKPSRKAQGKDSVDKTLQKHLQYIEQPPTGVKHTELIDEYWFISSEGKVIVEPQLNIELGSTRVMSGKWRKIFERKHIVEEKLLSQTTTYWILHITNFGPKPICGWNTKLLVRRSSNKNPWMVSKVGNFDY